MTQNLQPYVSRKAPPAYSPSWSDIEHQNIQRAIAVALGRIVSYSTKQQGLTGDGVTDDQAKLDTLVNVTMQPEGGFLDIVGVVRLASNVTIPANVELRFLGGRLAPDVGVTVTILGRMAPTFAYIFGGGGVIQFGVGAMVDWLYPEWWGALGGGADDTNALAACFTSLGTANGQGLRCRSTIYGVSSEITLPGLGGVVIKGGGGAGGWDGLATIKWIGAAAPTKAILRATSSAVKGFVGCQLQNIVLDANRTAGHAFIIEGSFGGTYHNDWALNKCMIRGGTKIGLLIGSIAGVIDVDAFPITIEDCTFDYSNINLFVNAQNAYGPKIYRTSFLRNIQAGASETLTHIRAIKSGDLRIHGCFFNALAPSAGAIDPETGAAVVWNAATPETSNIFSIRVDCRTTISACHSEEPRWLKAGMATDQMAGVEMSECSTNFDAHVDGAAAPRNIDWQDFHKGTNVYGGGAGALGSYCVVNNSNGLTIRNCQFGNGYTNLYRKMYNNGRLTLNAPDDALFLGAFGEVVHGASSLISEVNGVLGGGLPAQSNWDLSAWQDANTLYDTIAKFNGAGGVSTVTRSAANLLWGKNTVDLNVTNAAASFTNGLRVYFRLPFPKTGTLFFAGYSATDPSALRCYRGPGITAAPPDGSIAYLWNPTTKRYIAALPFTLDESIAVDQTYFIIGPESTFTGNFFFDAIMLVPGQIELSLASALTWHGATRTNVKREHFGTAAPTVGLWWKGDVIWKSDVAAAGVPGYMCTTGDGTTAGTWKAMAAVAA